MALLWSDSFDNFTVAATLTASYDAGSVLSLASIGAAKNGNGLAASSSNGVAWKLVKTVSSPTTIIVGFALNLTALPNASATDHKVIRVGSIDLVIVGASGGGSVVVKNGSTVLATAAFTLIASVWTYIEMKVLFSATVGTVDLHYNGTSVASASGLNTGTAPTSVTLQTNDGNGGGNNNYGEAVDNYYICDTSGSVNNDFLGPVKLFSLRPTGAGNYAQWTQTGGTGGQPWTAVNETEPNGDTSYVADNVVNDRSSFTFGSLADTSNAIKGIKVVLSTKKDDVVGRVICPMTRISSTDYDFSNYTETSAYVNAAKIQEQSPATSSAWTASEINAAEFGVKVVS